MSKAEIGPASQGAVPIAVVMISLNEGHNMHEILSSLKGWAAQIFLVDSYSSDDTIEIALTHGVHVVQRRFRGFGDQWNFALSELPISSPWTMKLDPDERLSTSAKAAIEEALRQDRADGYSLNLRLWFMGKPLSHQSRIVRLWRTGKCRFSDVQVNEHPIVSGRLGHIDADIDHLDSPDLHHWLEKQNRYTTAEAVAAHSRAKLAARPRFWGSALERRMWLKRNFWRLPFRYALLFLYHYFLLGAWRAGWVGYAWTHLRCEVYRLIEFKRRELELPQRAPVQKTTTRGAPDPRVPQF